MSASKPELRVRTQHSDHQIQTLRSVIHLRPGWTFEPRPKWPHWPFRPAPNGRQPPETSGQLRLL